MTVGEDSAEERLTRAEAKARTGERLLDEAAQTFARKGYAALRWRRWLRRAE